MKNFKSIVSIVFAASMVLMLAGCGNSDDGAMLSDQEKLDKMKQGRDSQMQQQAGPATETPR